MRLGNFGDPREARSELRIFRPGTKCSARLIGMQRVRPLLERVLMQR
jgi:hypothetical protein